jgi:hypothetical protein
MDVSGSENIRFYDALDAIDRELSTCPDPTRRRVLLEERDKLIYQAEIRTREFLDNADNIS